MVVAAQTVAGVITVRPLSSTDKNRWLMLWEAYLDFYDVALAPDATEHLWGRLHDAAVPVGGLVAIGERESVVGILHYVIHQNTWNTREICYLEDLFVDQAARGQGCAHKLIKALAEKAKTEGWGRLYWMTHKENGRARRLYDKVANLTDFIRYDYPL